MKAKLLVTGIFMGSCILSQAFTVAVANLVTADPAETPIVDLGNTPIAHASGSAAVGYFTGIDVANLATSSLTDLLTAFQIHGSEAALTNGFNAPGFMDNAYDAPIPEAGGSPFVGQNIYVFVGSGVTLAGSPNFLIYKAPEVFGEEVGGVGSQSVTMGDPGVLLAGSGGSAVDVLGITFGQTLQMQAPVPEPGIAALSLIGFLGLLRRRR